VSTFREFQTGFTLGQQQQNQRKLQTARADASALFDTGDYGGSESTLMKAGDMEGASAFAEAGARRKTEQRQDAYGNAMRTGGYEAVRGAAVEQGDIGMAADMDKIISSMGQEEREAASQRATFFGQAAYGLAQIKDPAQRQAAFQQIIATSGQAMGVTPEQAANFQLTDDNLKAVFMSSMKLADQIKMDQEGQPKPYTLGPGQQRFDENNNPIASVPPNERGNGISITTDENGRPVVNIGGPAQDGSQLTAPTKPEEGYYKDVGKYQAAKAQRDTMMNNLQKAKGMVSWDTTGVVGSIMKNVPGSKSVNLQERLKTVKTLVGFDALQQMRNNSPTGGALGAITEKELAFLQSVEGSLEQVQSEEQLNEILGEVETSINRIGTAQDAAFQYQYQALNPGETRGQPRANAGGPPTVYQGMSSDDLKKRADELRAKSGKQ